MGCGSPLLERSDASMELWRASSNRADFSCPAYEFPIICEGNSKVVALNSGLFGLGIFPSLPNYLSINQRSGPPEDPDDNGRSCGGLSPSVCRVTLPARRPPTTPMCPLWDICRGSTVRALGWPALSGGSWTEGQACRVKEKEPGGAAGGGG